VSISSFIFVRNNCRTFTEFVYASNISARSRNTLLRISRRTVQSDYSDYSIAENKVRNKSANANCASSNFSLRHLETACETSFPISVLCKFPGASYNHRDKFVLTGAGWILEIPNDANNHRGNECVAAASPSLKVLTSLIPFANLMVFLLFSIEKYS
jgi:hypothetical protein